MANSSTVQRWLALVWPSHRDLYFEAVIRALWDWTPRDLGRIEHHDRLGAALTTTQYPDETLGPQAHYIIALGLQAPDSNRLVAADVVVDAIATRR